MFPGGFHAHFPMGQGPSIPQICPRSPCPQGAQNSWLQFNQSGKFGPELYTAFPVIMRVLNAQMNGYVQSYVALCCRGFGAGGFGELDGHTGDSDPPRRPVLLRGVAGSRWADHAEAVAAGLYSRCTARIIESCTRPVNSSVLLSHHSTLTHLMN